MTAPSVVRSFLDHARRSPDAPALVWRGEQVTYGALAAMARRGCDEIARLDLPESEPVALVARKSPDAVALLIACQTLGRPVLLPAVDLGSEALSRLLEGAGVRHVLKPQPAPVNGADDAVAELAPAAPDPDRVAFLLTTSGSTGAPKIVPLSAGAVDRFVAWAVPTFGIEAGTTVLNYAPLNFDLCLLDVWTTLASGGTVVLVDQDRATSPGHLVDLLATNRVQVVQAVPMFYRLLMDSGARFPSVEHLIFTGDTLPRQVLARLPDLFPNARLYNVYGCTETNDSFVYEVDRARSAGTGTVPIGRPLPGVAAVLVGPDGQVVEGPGSGELLVSTPFQTRGYLGARGSDRFVRRPDGRVYFRSGDLVRRQVDGNLSLIGRNDFQVKVRGVRLNLQEVEQIILSHDQVVEAAVIAVPDDLATYRLAAFVRRGDGSTLDGLSLRAHCATRLPRAAIPSTIHLTDDPLPRTSTGKVDRQGMRLSLTRGEE